MLGRLASQSLLLRPCIRVGRHPFSKHSLRGFSTSPDNGDPSPRFESGFDLVMGMWRRTAPRLSKLQEYQENGAFIDSIGTLGKCVMFIQLQMPKKTTIDLLEFLEGAKTATEMNLRAMNSVAFAEFISDKENSSSDTADTLQQFTTPAFYNQMAFKVKTNYLQRKFYVECEAMRIEKAQLANVSYRRMTEKQYGDLVAFRKPVRGASVKSTVEHLRLYVDVAVVEDLNLVFMEEKMHHVQHQNIYRVAFESRATEPDEVDWRIENMHIIEQKAIPREVEEAGDNKKKDE